ncbi:unnamed protein product [Hydatigera taeniaeformis]|uniref:SHSP domain-containing protein n=1 Tax=Hydatigena taeniaeformis TaxID=6205 RepID=A0A0R3X6J1_HYDTA|nr:unnamed protein product [Hydatigera taeniaeformis]
MGLKISKLPSNQHGWNLQRQKRKDLNSRNKGLGVTYQSSPMGDIEKMKTITTAPLQTPEMKISPTSICSKTSSVELSFPSSSTPSTIPTLHSETDFNNAESIVDSDLVVDSRSHKNRRPQKTSTPSSEKKSSNGAKKPHRMVLTTAPLSSNGLGIEETKRGRFECHFWVPETALSVVTDKNDRRLRSIARSSGCSIELTDDTRLDPFGIPKRKVLIRSVTTYGMVKCRNLIEARFPSFTVHKTPVTKVATPH